MRRLLRPLDRSLRGVALVTRDGVRLSAQHTAGPLRSDLAIVVAMSPRPVGRIGAWLDAAPGNAASARMPR